MGSIEELFAAIEAGDVGAVRATLDVDASLAGARDGQGVSVVMRARYRLDDALLEAVMSAGPELDVYEAAALGDLDRMNELLAADPSLVSAFSADGFTPLHLAAFFGRSDAARALLEFGADVDARGRGWMTGTPLHSAASADHTDVASVLLDAGADPNARQSGGWTPLHATVMNGNLGLVELLLERGADAHAMNDDGATVVSLAEESRNAEVVARVRAVLEA
jgi:ankyrin repeat protein